MLTVDVAYVPGVWDLFHIGHVQFLARAAGVADVVIVGVPSDQVVFEDKGALPAIPLEGRYRVIQACRHVSMAVIYTRLEFLTHLRRHTPNYLIVGEDWGKEQRHLDAEDYMDEVGGQVIKLPYYHDESTTKIKERIRLGLTA